ncbi:hypothetical protein VTN00DRAFT_6403 [Thermoascus crustaceus]|uniref:uncharacterized protein n=1 Tax=Thermoascus crustaceus TaxID=5088 RepID=UPI003742583F
MDIPRIEPDRPNCPSHTDDSSETAAWAEICILRHLFCSYNASSLLIQSLMRPDLLQGLVGWSVFCYELEGWDSVHGSLNGESSTESGMFSDVSSETSTLHTQ